MKDASARRTRRTFLNSIAATTGAGFFSSSPPQAAIPPMKLPRVRAYAPPNLNPLLNQRNMVVRVETDAGLIGMGEGGSKDTLEQCGGRLIGQDPQFIERLGQDIYRAFFSPPGREKIHAL